jgi:hypothetical protein
MANANRSRWGRENQLRGSGRITPQGIDVLPDYKGTHMGPPEENFGGRFALARCAGIDIMLNLKDHGATHHSN